MKRKRKEIFLLLAINVIFISCSKDKEESPEIILPEVEISEVNDINFHSAFVEAQINTKEIAAILDYGFCFSKKENPEIDDTLVKAENLDSNGRFSASVADLDEGSLYNLRAYAVNIAGIAYSENYVFSTNAYSISDLVITDVTDVLYTEAKVSGKIEILGNPDIVALGLCLSTQAQPLVNDLFIEIEEINENGSFEISLSELQANTTYYVNVYALYNDVEHYSEDYVFSTKETAAPVVGEAELLEISDSDIKILANIENDMGEAVVARGVCWNERGEPSLNDNFLEFEEGTGDFEVLIEELFASETYYIRVFATNKNGTSYGEQMEVKTAPGDLATVYAGGIATITGLTAEFTGRIARQGGSPVKSYGVCWSTKEEPTIEDDYIEVGEGTGSYKTKIKWLKPGTVYYVRGYGINNDGIAYGSQLEFSTPGGKVTYTLHKAENPSADELDAYNRITKAMDEALYYYNKYTAFEKHLNIYYNPSVETADGNINGTIRFGNKSTMQKVTAMHEIAHTMGVGTTWQWQNSLMVNGVYKGANANEILRYLTNNNNEFLKGDGAHFWPYGLNYTHEYKSENDLIFHCLIVYSMVLDGL